MRMTQVLFMAAGIALITACAKTGTTGFSADKPNAIIAAVEDAVKTAGEGLVTGRVKLANPFFRISPSDCDIHGYPVGNDQSQGTYPGYLTYCFVTVDSGDTVIGGFSLAKQISCALEKAGVQFDGVPHTVVISSSTGCFGEDAEVPDSMTATLTGTSPASFNTNFDKGVVIDLDSAIGLTFKIAATASTGNISFITSESWSDDGRVGATAGSLDTSTGQARYESRVERIDCTTASSCGWNRHTRIYAKLEMNGSEPTGLDEISFAYSNIQAPPGQSGYAGVLITSSGDLTTGVKARLWQATHTGGGAPTAESDYQIVANWTEVANTKCYTHSSETAGTCGSGLAKFSTNTKFLLDGNHTALTTWFANASTQTFTAVDVDEDVQ